MYNTMPYPDYGDNPLNERYLSEKKLIDLTLGFNGQGFSVYEDKEVLDGGCGTGRESMYMASMGAKVTAIDITEKSLEIAQNQAGKYNFKHGIRFKKASVLAIPFADNKFDMVVSAGVIHHTADPEKAFSELARVLKPNGYLALFVYNTWAHIIPNLRRKIVHLFAGKDIHKRAAVALKIFPRYLKNNTLARVYDEFAHPHKSEHSIAEVLSWFSKYNISYQSVFPRFGGKGFVYYLRAKNLYLSKGRLLIPPKKYNEPTALNRFLSAMLMILLGFKQYSYGYRFMGIKAK